MTRIEAEKRAAKAAKDHAAAVADVEAKRGVLSQAENAHDEAQSATSRTAVIAARVDLESSERIAAKKTAALNEARATLAEGIREEKRATLVEARAKLAAFGTAIAPHVAGIVDVYDRLDAHALGMARVVIDYGKTHATAKALAAELGEMAPAPAPTLADAKLAGARALRGRDDLSSFIVPDAGDWRTAASSAREIADLDAAKRRNRAAEQHAADVQAGIDHAAAEQAARDEAAKTAKQQSQNGAE